MQQNRVKKGRKDEGSDKPDLGTFGQRPQGRHYHEEQGDLAVGDVKSAHRLPRKFNAALLYRRLGQSLNAGTIGPCGHLPKPFHEALNLPLDRNHHYQPRSDADALDLVQGELVVGAEAPVTSAS